MSPLLKMSGLVAESVAWMKWWMRWMRSEQGDKTDVRRP